MANRYQLTASERGSAMEGLVDSAQAVWLDRGRDYLENYRAALTLLIERGRPKRPRLPRACCSSG